MAYDEEEDLDFEDYEDDDFFGDENSGRNYNYDEDDYSYDDGDNDDDVYEMP